MADFEIIASGPTTFAISGELDLATAPLVDVAIGQTAARGGSILVDVSELTFADSSGIGAIVRSAQALTPGCLVLHGVREQVTRAIDVMGIGRGVSNLHVMPCLVGGEPLTRD